MFTGLVETIGRLRHKSGGAVSRVQIEASLGKLDLGESIAVNGVCLTVDRILPSGFEADVSPETLARTTLGGLTLGAAVHLERATPLGGRMGGHVVLGHVDGIGQVVDLLYQSALTAARPFQSSRSKPRLVCVVFSHPRAVLPRLQG